MLAGVMVGNTRGRGAADVSPGAPQLETRTGGDAHELRNKYELLLIVLSRATIAFNAQKRNHRP
jgi:hypothetical protein